MKNIIALLLVTIFISSCGSSKTDEIPTSSDTAPAIATEESTQNPEEIDVKDTIVDENINTTGTGDEITPEEIIENSEEESTNSSETEDELVDQTIQEIDDLFKLLESDDK